MPTPISVYLPEKQLTIHGMVTDAKAMGFLGQFLNPAEQELRSQGKIKDALFKFGERARDEQEKMATDLEIEYRDAEKGSDKLTEIEDQIYRMQLQAIADEHKPEGLIVDDLYADSTSPMFKKAEKLVIASAKKPSLPNRNSTEYKEMKEEAIVFLARVEAGQKIAGDWIHRLFSEADNDPRSRFNVASMLIESYPDIPPELVDVNYDTGRFKNDLNYEEKFLLVVEVVAEFFRQTAKNLERN